MVSSALWNCSQFRMLRPEQLPGTQTQAELTAGKATHGAVLWGQDCSEPSPHRYKAVPFPWEGCRLQELLCSPHMAADRVCRGANKQEITVAGH